MTAADILRDSLELLSDPARWTKGAYARAANGHAVASWDPSAVCWCATGAPSKAAGVGNDEARLKALRTLALVLGTGSVPAYNDHPDRTHAEIIALYKRALALAEAGS